MSLRARLASWYACLSLAVVAVACTYAYAVHSRTHYDEIDKTLRETAGHLAYVIARNPAGSSEIVNLPMSASVTMINSKGRETVRAKGAPDLRPKAGKFSTQQDARPYGLLARMAPSIHHPGTGAGHFDLAVDRGGARYRTFTVQIADGNYLALATPLQHIDSAMRRFAWLMVLIGAVGALAAFVVGYAIAARAFRPLSLVTDAAAGIASSREFSRRVPEGSSHDEIGSLSRTFNAMLASLEASYDSEVRFVSAASHEIRTPLTAIQANLDLLQSGALSNEDRVLCLQEASRECERMVRLVSDLLSLARSDAGVPLSRRIVEIDRIVLDALSESRHLARGRRLELTRLDTITVSGDPDKLMQLVLNIIENALKYTALTGTVSAGICRVSGGAEIVIRDNGIGIPAEDLPHICDRFFRSSEARSLDPSGSGLGLSIARSIVTEHRGTLSIDSSPGRGTTVSIWLPTAQSANGQKVA